MASLGELIDKVDGFDSLTPYRLNTQSDAKQIELFNCYLRIGDKKQIIPTVDRSELERMFQTIKDGKERVLINGRYIEVSNFNSFKIVAKFTSYDVNKS